MNPDMLIKGHPYYYKSKGGQCKTQVLYDKQVFMYNGSVTYHFLFRREVKPGFVNLSYEQVKELITTE